jgi:hypothetical protein
MVAEADSARVHFDAHLLCRELQYLALNNLEIGSRFQHLRESPFRHFVSPNLY